MIDQINNRFENNYFMLGVIIGLSKAFVTVEYSILIKNSNFIELNETT